MLEEFSWPAKQSLKQLWEDAVFERWAVAIGLLSGLVLWLLPIGFDPSQADRFLSTLVTAQASIVAIVFSVSILGVQLVANRYSARMMTLITSSTAFQRTLIVLALSIGFDLTLLLQLPVLSPALTMAGLAVTAGLATAAGITLVRYVETTLERSSPEGLLTAYAERMTPDQYRRGVIESREENGALHPMHELHSFVMSGLSNGEWATAQNGILELTRVSEQMIESLAADGFLHRGDPLSRHYFKPTIEGYLPRITTQAIEDGEDDLAQEAVRSIQSISEVGLDNHFPLLLGSTASGLSRIIREAPRGESGDSIRGACLRTYSELVVEVSRLPAPSDLRTLLALYAAEFRKLLVRDREPWVYRQALREFFRRTISPAHEQTIEHYGQFIAQADVDWHSRTQPMGLDGIAPYDLLFTYRRYSLEVIGHMIGYYNRNEEWPADPSLLRSTWTELIGHATDAGDYGAAVCRWYIDLAYVLSQLDDAIMEDWAVSLAIVQDEHSANDCIQAAFERAIEDGLTPPIESKIQRVTSSSERRWYFNKIMDLPHGGAPTHSEWVQRFREVVDESRQSTPE